MPRTCFSDCSCPSSLLTELQNLTILSAVTSDWPPVMVTMIWTKTSLLSRALAVGRLVSPSTVLQRDLSERDVIFCLSPSSEMAVEVLQNPLTTLTNVGNRLYLYRASSNKGTRT